MGTDNLVANNSYNILSIVFAARLMEILVSNSSLKSPYLKRVVLWKK